MGLQDELITYSIDPDWMPRCPWDGARTFLVEQIDHDYTLEQCPDCKRQMRFIVED
ncbi:hypothetical protein UFOVP1298_11 [uncultured Caudovirales phage]|jgi:hypothetical protein|uniref:Uncharacterized protein n=1 Tax=uncultured Caudovirales phage TaxID=2100421 RepID=A0A6J5RE54_9CAUD|nr:hypothetical protein UFOVP1298_11 [uncultured Caudovirales phage]